MRRPGGFAMIAALMLMSLLALIAIAVLSLSAADRRRAVRHTRTEVRENCAYSGLTYARTFFGNNFANWNTYLANPTHFNPMNLPGTTTPVWGGAKADLSTVSSIGIIRAAQPNLFMDLDNDGLSDVYIFIRDNPDEFAPAVPNYQRDNDQNVIVGAVCISSTMQPKRERTVTWAGYSDIDPDRMVVESMLSVNTTNTNSSGVATDGNFNNQATN